MAERITKEDFGEKLICEFGTWAAGTEELPYKEECKKIGMKKFEVTSDEYEKLLGFTAMYWVF